MTQPKKQMTLQFSNMVLMADISGTISIPGGGQFGLFYSNSQSDAVYYLSWQHYKRSIDSRHGAKAFREARYFAEQIIDISPPSWTISSHSKILLHWIELKLNLNKYLVQVQPQIIDKHYQYVRSSGHLSGIWEAVVSVETADLLT